MSLGAGEGFGRARAVLVAAGASTRMQGVGGVRKPLIELGGCSLLEHAVRALSGCPQIASIVVVAHADDVAHVTGLAQENPAFASVVAVVPGGALRSDSVRLGVLAQPHLREEPAHDLLCVHDAARPFVDAEAIGNVLAAARRDGAAILAVRVRDTLKESEDGEVAVRTVDRSKLWAAQTPQAFERERFLDCLERGTADGLVPTDDAALWESYVGPVTLVRGDATGFKITGPSDLDLAQGLLDGREGRR
jgi:2-C-methyl-D-erythritol 4-phosphate cytidylyltransferase